MIDRLISTMGFPILIHCKTTFLYWIKALIPIIRAKLILMNFRNRRIYGHFTILAIRISDIGKSFTDISKSSNFPILIVQVSTQYGNVLPSVWKTQTICLWPCYLINLRKRGQGYKMSTLATRITVNHVWNFRKYVTCFNDLLNGIPGLLQNKYHMDM